MVGHDHAARAGRRALLADEGRRARACVMLVMIFRHFALSASATMRVAPERSPSFAPPRPLLVALAALLARDGGGRDRVDLARRQHQHAGLVGQDRVAGLHRHAAARDQAVENAAEIVEPRGDRREAAAPQRKVGLLDLELVGAGTVDDAGDGARRLRRDRDAAAPAGVPVVAEPVDHQDVAGAQQPERMMQQGRVRVPGSRASPRCRRRASLFNSGWMPRSMKPQWRQWPTVAVSTFGELGDERLPAVAPASRRYGSRSRKTCQLRCAGTFAAKCAMKRAVMSTSFSDEHAAGLGARQARIALGDARRVDVIVFVRHADLGALEARGAEPGEREVRARGRASAASQPG